MLDPSEETWMDFNLSSPELPDRNFARTWSEEIDFIQINVPESYQNIHLTFPYDTVPTYDLCMILEM